MELVADQSESQSFGHQTVWRRNAPYMYQLLYTSQLEWPSLTVQWLPDQDHQKNVKNSELYTVNELILGTHTSNQEQNYLLIAKVRVPNQEAIQKKYRESRPSKTDTVKKNDHCMEEKIQIMHRIPHQGEVNRARHSPHQRKYIATRTPFGQIHVFNTFKLRRQNTKPDIILQGHDTEGYALEWNPHKMGHILAGSYDGKLSMWDIKHAEEKSNPVPVYSPVCNFKFHEREIQDISHHKMHESVFASCDDVGNNVFWDSRSGKFPVYHKKCHQGVVYSIQFSPHFEYHVASGGADSVVKVWDIRNHNQPVYQMNQQSQKEVTQVKWSAHDAQFIWSACDKKVSMWEITEQKLKFVHAGHRSAVAGIDTCVNEPDTIASVGENNEIQVFQPNQNCKI